MFGEGEEGKAPEIVEAPPSPLAERLRDFRDGVGEQPEEDIPAASEEETSDDDQGDDQQEQDAGDQDDAADGTEGADDADADDAADDDDAGADDDGRTTDDGADDDAAAGARGTDTGKARDREYDVDLPTLNADGSKGPAGTGVLRLEGLPQEYRDTIQSHVKRSMQLDGALQRLEQARELETMARFYQSDPLNAMRLVAAEKPELAQTFVAQWVLQNPKAALALIREHKLDNANEETLTLRGKVAAGEMKDGLKAAFASLEQEVTKQRYTEIADDAVAELVYALRLDEEGIADFQGMADSRLSAEARRRLDVRQSPYLTKAEIVTLLQPLVRKFTGATSTSGKDGKDKAGRPNGKGTKLSPKQQAERARNADKFRRLRPGGHRAGGTGVRPAGLKKGKLPSDLKERIKLLRSGKL